MTTPATARASGAVVATRTFGLERLNERVLLALLPCLLLGLYSTGRLANVTGVDLPTSMWGRVVIDATGADPSDGVSAVLRGLLIVLPILLTALFTAELWRRAFRRLGRAEVAGFAATGLLFSMLLPPATPTWQVALGLTFGIVIGKEIFGGTGMNFLNPALVGIAFLYFAYPDSMRGESIWTAFGGEARPPMALVSSAGEQGLEAAGIGWLDAFVGRVAGPLGATSTLGCLLGAIILLRARFISWRVLAGALLGLTITAAVVSTLATPDALAATLPWYWHLNIGGFAFALVFLACDPVTAATTNPGRWIYGAFIGAMTVVIRIANPAQTEAALLAVLLGGIVAPAIDYGFTWANIRRRKRRHG